MGRFWVGQMDLEVKGNITEATACQSSAVCNVHNFNTFANLNAQKDSIYQLFFLNIAVLCPFEQASWFSSFQVFTVPVREICFADRVENYCSLKRKEMHNQTSASSY